MSTRLESGGPPGNSTHRDAVSVFLIAQIKNLMFSAQHIVRSSKIRQTQLPVTPAFHQLLRETGICLIPDGSTVREGVQANEAEFRSQIVQPVSKSTETSIRQQTPRVQGTSSPCLTTASRPARYTQRSLHPLLVSRRLAFTKI